jgi:ribulose 1,5-bisphosphate carboxylase large subunit-like protein
MGQGESMTNHQRIAKDEPERIVLNNIAEFGWHAVNIIEDNVSGW